MIGADGLPLSADEASAVRALQRLAKRWPKSLWLFSASGTLCVMRNGPDGQRVMDGIGVDSAATVWSTRAIENDGGDW
jgi:hypothetical protein